MANNAVDYRQNRTRDNIHVSLKTGSQAQFIDDDQSAISELDEEDEDGDL